MRRIRTLALLTVAACASGGALAAAGTSHKGWPVRTGILWISDHHGNAREKHGTSRNDELLGAHGPNRLYGEAGRDVIWGDYKASGQNTVQIDHLYGGAGSDFIYASHGVNRIDAGEGKDVIHAHYGRGTIRCGPGPDTLFISHRAKRRYSISGCERISFKTLGR